jgi:hypothetical protein
LSRLAKAQRLARQSAGRDCLASAFGGPFCAFTFGDLARQFGAAFRVFFEKRDVLSRPMLSRPSSAARGCA